MSIQQTPSTSDLTMRFSVEYANEWFLRFGDECPISGDNITHYRAKAHGPEFAQGVPQ